MKDEWRSIALHYEVSDQGNIRSLPHTDRGRLWPGKVLAPFRDGVKGYLAVDFLGKRHKLHRLVATAFHGRGIGLQVNHKNGDPGDNRAENLEWVTGSQNVRHSFDVLGKASAGGHKGKTGSRHHASKAVIATHLETGDVRSFGSGAEAARFIGLAAGTVPRCCAGTYPSAKGWSFRYDRAILDTLIELARNGKVKAV